MTEATSDLRVEHKHTLDQLNSGIRSILDQINLTQRAQDKNSLAQALKTLLECRRIEELLEARSTVQRILERLKDDPSKAGHSGEGEVKSPEQIANEFAADFGTAPEHAPSDFSAEDQQET